eukprot:scaffold1509_cov240-Pinguiococcus_pyrenoidosus.AAC.10
MHQGGNHASPHQVFVVLRLRSKIAQRHGAVLPAYPAQQPQNMPPGWDGVANGGGLTYDVGFVILHVGDQWIQGAIFHNGEPIEGRGCAIGDRQRRESLRLGLRGLDEQVQQRLYRPFADLRARVSRRKVHRE